MLAGDTLRAAADWGLPLVAITLLHRKGYFRQHLDDNGAQSEEPDSWNPEERLREMEPRVEVEVGGQPVRLRAWFKELQGVLGQLVPVYFLDSDVEDNDDASRRLTDVLYGGDDRYRLSQETILGIGGVRYAGGARLHWDRDLPHERRTLRSVDARAHVQSGARGRTGRSIGRRHRRRSEIIASSPRTHRLRRATIASPRTSWKASSVRTHGSASASCTR